VITELERRLCAAATDGPTSDEMGEVVSRAIAGLVAHDSLHLSWRNPGTNIAAFGFWHRHTPELDRRELIDRYCRPDAVDPVEQECLVVNARDRSELRLFLRGSHGAWGTLVLSRAQGAFEPDEADRAVGLVGPLVAASRCYVRSAPLWSSGPDLAPGVLMVGPDHTVRAVTPEGRAWLREIRLPGALATPEWAATALASEVSLASRRFAVDPTASRPMTCLPAAFAGRWVSVHAQAFTADGAGDVTVIIQAAGADLLPALSSWYDLTRRERAVIDHLREGICTKQIARRLELSVHTVNDYLKAVYRKTTLSGRDEIMAVLSR